MSTILSSNTTQHNTSQHSTAQHSTRMASPRRQYNTSTQVPDRRVHAPNNELAIIRIHVNMSMHMPRQAKNKATTQRNSLSWHLAIGTSSPPTLPGTASLAHGTTRGTVPGRCAWKNCSQSFLPSEKAPDAPHCDDTLLQNHVERHPGPTTVAAHQASNRQARKQKQRKTGRGNNYKTNAQIKKSQM